MIGSPDPEARRLEDLWAGAFGEAYTARNAGAAAGREPFWTAFLAKYPVTGVLEVGCNFGVNLTWICRSVPPRAVVGIDISEAALRQLRGDLPRVRAVVAAARTLPFRDSTFDLVFTAGVLIHQPNSTLGTVMAEVVRCARRYVLCLEYFAQETVEVPYRGQQRALFKRNYGRLYQEMFPELVARERGFLSRAQGWDDVTVWVFEKPK